MTEKPRLGPRVLLRVVWLYRVVRGPHLPTCRYVPTCSEYAAEALGTHGARRGLSLAVKRLARCHPWGGWGVDPVPDVTPSEDASRCRPTN